MMSEIARRLDRWIAEQNHEARREGLLALPGCVIEVLGQTALMEEALPVSLASTVDVDVKADYVNVVQKEFERLLAEHGRILDPVGHEIWMPRETRYREVFGGPFVRLLVADPEAVLLSKALKAPVKNRELIVEYLALGASERFMSLALEYSLDLEQFL